MILLWYTEQEYQIYLNMINQHLYEESKRIAYEQELALQQTRREYKEYLLKRSQIIFSFIF